MCRIIGVINFKGGVAKTTTVINLGTALWILGKKVLMVDTDSQSNLTITMKHNEEGRTINEWMRGQIAEPPVFERYDGLDYIPANANLETIETYLNPLPTRNHALKELLDPLRDYYDYILIDCSPKTGVMNHNVLIAADEILIPTDIGPYSIVGLNQLKENVSQIQSKPYLNPNLKICGIVRVEYDKRLNASKGTTELLNSMFDGKVLNVCIRSTVKVSEAPNAFMSMFEYAPDATATNDYMRLGEIIEGKKRPINWQTKAIKAFKNSKELA